MQYEELGAAAPNLMPIAVVTMQKLYEANLPWAKLDGDMNEIWAYHGTKSKPLDSIARVGLDHNRILNDIMAKDFILASSPAS